MDSQAIMASQIAMDRWSEATEQARAAYRRRKVAEHNADVAR